MNKAKNADKIIEVIHMINYTWSDFTHMSQSQQRKMLSKMKTIAAIKGGIDLFMYNKYAEQYHMKKV